AQGRSARTGSCGGPVSRQGTRAALPGLRRAQKRPAAVQFEGTGTGVDETPRRRRLDGFPDRVSDALRAVDAARRGGAIPHPAVHGAFLVCLPLLPCVAVLRPPVL